MIIDLYRVFRKIILNVKHGLLLIPAHCTKQTKHYTSTVYETMLI